MSSLRVALAQIDTYVGDIDRNIDTIVDYVGQAVAGHAQLVVFPEMTIAGYPIEDLALRATFRRACKRGLDELNKRLLAEGLSNIYVAVGLVGQDQEEDSSDQQHVKPRNRLALLHNGNVVLSYDKQCLPNYGVFDEYRIFSSGSNVALIDLDGVRCGFAICEDIWQDDGPVGELAEHGIDVLITMNGSPYEEGKTQIRQELACQRAHQLQAPVVYVNQVGGQDDLVFDGGSFVLDADGHLLVSAPMFRQALSYFDYDVEQKKQKQGLISPSLPADEEVYCACVLGLRDYMHKNGFQGVCLGLSGGIDSALVATMAADACGGNNVWGISMPSMYSSDGSKDDARDLAKRLQAHYDIQPIEPVFTAFQKQLNLTGIAAENLQARIRGVMVMAYSNEKGLLALATGNKSELACGYSTIYGDAVGGYAPIKDLLKTRVWSLAKWRNDAMRRGVGLGMLPICHAQEYPVASPLADGVVIPINSIVKPPSAELRPGQKDSDSLPDYALLDRVLEAHIECAYGKEDLLKAGFDEKTVSTVMRLVDRAEWKRRQYPLGPKVSALAFGRDRRMPVTTAFRQ